jgi:hypothetical protein
VLLVNELAEILGRQLGGPIDVLRLGLHGLVIQAAGSPGGGTRARPNTLVVLVKTNRRAFAAAASSRRFSVPRTFVSTKAWREWVTTCGLWSVAV